METLEVIKLVGIILGANGLWKLIEALLQLRSGRRQKSAETSNLYVQANSQVVENWREWSKKLEDRIEELEMHVGKLQKRNTELESELEELKNSKEKDE
ncbi:MAG: hypothetical protein ABJQ69_03510 [Ekhidna sp.]